MAASNKDGYMAVINEDHDSQDTTIQSTLQQETNDVPEDDQYKSVKQFTASTTTEKKYRMLEDHVCNKYQEAALYLAEGLEDEDLDNHPTNARCYRAYRVFHNPVYYITELIVCILLLLLGFIEEPTFLDYDILNHVIAPMLELLFLLYLSSSVILKLLWKCRFSISDHRFTMIKIILIFVMFAEAIVVLSRRKSHFRITRCLRPLFLLSTIALKDVKRMLWQIFMCIGPIIDVLLLLFFFIASFAVSGFYLFGAISQSPTNDEFDTFGDSFISLYILITTANFPDVMMQYYDRRPLAPLFFVIFLIIGLYIIINVLLAVIHSTFKDVQKETFRKIHLHRRNALHHAFRTLSKKESQENVDVLSMDRFLKLMHYYSRFTSKLTCVCMFKAMKENRARSSLKIEEFYSFYDIQGIRWIRLNCTYEKEARWYHKFSKPWPILEKLTDLVDYQYFIAIMNVIVLTNAIIFFTLSVHAKDHEGKFEQSKEALSINMIFVIIYLLEIAFKLFALGPAHFFRYYWNM